MHFLKCGILFTLVECYLRCSSLHADQNQNQTYVKTEETTESTQNQNQTSPTNPSNSNKSQAQKPQIKFNKGAIHFIWSY